MRLKNEDWNVLVLHDGTLSINDGTFFFEMGMRSRKESLGWKK